MKLCPDGGDNQNLKGTTFSVLKTGTGHTSSIDYVRVLYFLFTDGTGDPEVFELVTSPPSDRGEEGGTTTGPLKCSFRPRPGMTEELETGAGRSYPGQDRSGRPCSHPVPSALGEWSRTLMCLTAGSTGEGKVTFGRSLSSKPLTPRPTFSVNFVVLGPHTRDHLSSPLVPLYFVSFPYLDLPSLGPYTSCPVYLRLPVNMYLSPSVSLYSLPSLSVSLGL